jgi:hypothetical protein
MKFITSLKTDIRLRCIQKFVKYHSKREGHGVVRWFEPEGGGFDSRWGNWNFSLDVILVSIQHQTGVSPGGIKAAGTYGGLLPPL